MKSFLRILLVGCASLFLLWGQTLFAAMTSTSYQIQWDAFSSGGNETATSTNYAIYDTIGQAVAGESTSTNYQAQQGYRVNDEPETLELSVRAIDTATKSVYSTINIAGNTLTASTTGIFAIGDFVVAVEGDGFAQIAVVGKITNIAGDTITVDSFQGASSMMSAIPSGTNYVYQADQASFVFSEFAAPNTLYTSIVYSSVNANTPNGYTVQMVGRQDLYNVDLGNIVPAVYDGGIVLGDNEYGISATGTGVQITNDTAITTSTNWLTVQSRNAPSISPSDRMVMTYKISLDTATILQSGTYSQLVDYTLTARY